MKKDYDFFIIPGEIAWVKRKDQNIICESGDNGSSVTNSLVRNRPIRFNMHLNVDRDIRNVFLNLASE